MSDDRAAASALSDVSFEAHLNLLGFFLGQRAQIVERIQDALNAQRKPVEYLRDRRALARDFEDCFFMVAGCPPDHSSLRGQLLAVHWASGFTPRESPGMTNDLIDPAELMRRGFHLWATTRWPGRAPRLRYANTLFNLYLIRQLALLGMRAWDGGGASAGERLSQLQTVLEELWKSSPADQPVLVRDVRSLIPVALSPATEALAPYFEVARHIGTTASDDDRVEILKAVARMAGGHLRSYLHYYITQKSAVLDELSFVLLVRRSNALDLSLLIHSLVPLLEAYERAVENGDRGKRRDLAGAICQGVSPDPELLIARVDLLAAYSMVEYLFTTTSSDGHVMRTPLGQRHVELLDEYAARITRLSQALYEDCAQFRPIAGAYSPYGALYGISSNLLEHMALKILDRDADMRFGLEDVFTDGGADKLAWVNGWRKLPHVDEQVAQLYAYPQWFAETMFVRLERALRARALGSNGDGDSAGASARANVSAGASATAGTVTAAGAATGVVTRTGRLFIVASEGSDASRTSYIAKLPPRFIVSSDPEIVAAGNALACDAAKIKSDRQEGHFLVSYETANGWVAISKDVLTEVLGAGCDAKLAGLPTAAIENLVLSCRDLVAR